MDGNDTQTWVTGGLKKYRNDFYFAKNPPAEDSSDYSARSNDAPTQSKSRAALILTEVEEQLEEHESKYNSMKDTFDYMKKLYMGSGTNPPEITDFNKASGELPLTETISPRNPGLNSLVDDEKGSDDNAAFEETQYYDFYTENAPSDDRRRDENEPTEQSPQYSARSYKISPRQDIYLGVQDGNSSDSSPQNYFSEEASGEEKKIVVLAEPSDDAVVDDDIQIHRDDGFSDISNSRQHPYQLHLAEYSKSIHEDSRDAEASPREQDQEIYSNNHLGSARTQDGKKPELFLNLSGSIENEQITKTKKSKLDKHIRKGSVTSTNKKNFCKQVDDSLCGVTKIRRKKRRLKASNSRSTTATRDTFFPAENKREVRKRKQRGHATMPASQSSQHRHEITAKIQQNWSEVVEIYHNRALKSGSLSVVSSKHSRLETRGRNAVSANTYDQRSEIKNPHLFAGSNDHSADNLIESELQRALKSPKNSPRIDAEGNDTQEKIYYDSLQDATDLRSGEPNRTKLIYKAERSTIPNANQPHEEFNGCHHHHHHHRCPGTPVRSSAYYDPMATRNYELPTVASKMKRVNRSYFNRFNFRNIPFVVGTSVTPSYNLGLNIQETLSLIKTRQRMPGGVTPLLISKVSKGVRPVSTLLGCVGDQDEIPVEESGTHFDEQRLSCMPDAQPCFDTQQSCAKTTEVPSTKKRKTQSICSSMKFQPHKNAESHLQLTPSALLRQRQEELNIGDSQSTNMNGIREVLVNFHDQFEAMNMKYEKLQEQAEKSNDESLKKELATLEKDLSAKEEEINAVVNLYKEVLALKQQMKLLHERNSLVCVATESPGSPMYPQISSRGETANPMSNLYRPSGSSNSRGPSTSTRLAGLLRQIKIFQKQLK